MRRPIVGIIGAGSCSSDIEELAADVGREIARNGAALICGGLGGVMTAAARGAREMGGPTIGILPGPDVRAANAYIDYPVATNMGQARNAVIVQTAEVLIAVAGEYGTLSEIALALKIGKAVVALRPTFTVPGVRTAENAKEAVALALSFLEHNPE